MFKYILILIIGVLFIKPAVAENSDTVRSYLKNSGQKVATIDSADFFRVVLPPDDSFDKDLYRVFDYYVDGKLKGAATSLTNSGSLVLDGNSIEYFHDGKRKAISRWKNGRINGEVMSYYPNGKLYAIMKIVDLFDRAFYGRMEFGSDGYRVEVVEMRDSTGKVLAANGTGHLLIFDEDFKKVIREGDMKNNKKEGEWRGPIADSGRFICTYHKDQLKSGISYMESGHRYTFKQLASAAAFSDGRNQFDNFIQRNLQYPESAKKRNIKGRVVIGFYVEINGTVSGVTVVRGLFKSLDDEAVRIISLSPLWIPAYQYGIPMRSYHTVPVYFD